MPDATSSTLDYCAAYSIDATFEFDPDKAPKVRAPTLRFAAVAEGDFQCAVTITEPAVCGVGYYRMDSSSGSVQFTTFDCSGVGDDYEGNYTSSTRYL
jgi:hypothetical protein